MWPAVISVAFILGPFLVWLIWHGHGYKRALLERAPGSDWIATDGSFVDPSSGEVAQVWRHPASGERAYVRRGRPARAG